MNLETLPCAGQSLSSFLRVKNIYFPGQENNSVLLLSSESENYPIL